MNTMPIEVGVLITILVFLTFGLLEVYRNWLDKRGL